MTRQLRSRRSSQLLLLNRAYHQAISLLLLPSPLLLPYHSSLIRLQGTVSVYIALLHVYPRNYHEIATLSLAIFLTGIYGEHTHRKTFSLFHV